MTSSMFLYLVYVSEIRYKVICICFATPDDFLSNICNNTERSMIKGEICAGVWTLSYRFSMDWSARAAPTKR